MQISVKVGRVDGFLMRVLIAALILLSARDGETAELRKFTVGYSTPGTRGDRVVDGERDRRVRQIQRGRSVSNLPKSTNLDRDKRYRAIREFAIELFEIAHRCLLCRAATGILESQRLFFVIMSPTIAQPF